jgi:hypothetical protein
MRVQFRGTGVAVWVGNVNSKTAPTAAEIAGGVRLQGFLDPGGMDTPRTGKTIDISDAGSRFNKTAAGSYGGDAGKLTAYRDSLLATDLAWATLVDGAVGFLVIARFGFAQSGTTGLGTAAGVAATGDRCEVWPSTVIVRAPVNIADGKANMFTADLAFTDDPALDALVP